MGLDQRLDRVADGDAEGRVGVSMTSATDSATSSGVIGVERSAANAFSAGA